MKDIKITDIVNKLREEAKKSIMCHKHACIAYRNGRIISPPFHNYMRSYIFNFRCGSAHAEIATINYLLSSLFKEYWYKNKQYVL